MVACTGPGMAQPEGAGLAVIAWKGSLGRKQTPKSDGSIAVRPFIVEGDSAVVGGKTIAPIRRLDQFLDLLKVAEGLFGLLVMGQRVFSQPQMQLGGLMGGEMVR